MAATENWGKSLAFVYHQARQLPQQTLTPKVHEQRPPHRLFYQVQGFYERHTPRELFAVNKPGGNAGPTRGDSRNQHQKVNCTSATTADLKLSAPNLSALNLRALDPSTSSQPISLSGVSESVKRGGCHCRRVDNSNLIAIVGLKDDRR